ncbi:glycosyltransferase family 4 protein [Vibrio sp. 10N.222.52.B7]|uniref:glycosyltransferase family 4 protein n=1 Tax=Vibrio sp. 10N.222.52.B7 TaxID=3229629 RepID=UPI00354C3BDD
MKKILIVSKEYPPFVGGAGTVASEYCKLLSGEFDVKVLTVSHSKKGYSDNVVAVENDFLWPFRFRHYIVKNDFDLVIFNDSSAIYFLGLFFWSMKLPLCVGFLHGSEPEKIINPISLKRKLIAYKFFYLKGLNAVNRVVAVSKFMRNKFLRSIEPKKLEARIDVLYSPVDKFSFVSENQPYLANSPKDEKHILTVGRVIKGKGHDRLLLIFERLYKSDSSWRWSVVGDGEELANLKSKALSLEVGSNVFFHGNKSRMELKSYYERASCMVQISDLEESFGLVYIESNLFGTPVIGRKHSGMLESINDQVSGYLLDSDEEIYQTLVEQKFLKLNENEIRSHANRFNGHVIVDYFCELMRRG